MRSVIRNAPDSDSAHVLLYLGLCTGKPLQAYAATATEEAREYDEVKEAIIQQYDINEEPINEDFEEWNGG